MFNSVPDMAHNSANRFPDAVAFEDDSTGKTWTFSQINNAADAVAAALSKRGLKEGDRIGLLSLNRAEYHVILFACQKTGIICCNINWRMPVAEIVDCLGPLSVSLLIHDSQNAPVAEGVSQALGQDLASIDADVAGWISAGGPALDEMIPAERPWYVLFTSGTTGRAKACIQNARMAWANAVNCTQGFSVGPDSASVIYMPLFHTAGVNLFGLSIFLMGGQSFILPQFEPSRLLELVRDRKITHFFAVPQIYQMLSLHDDIETADWNGLVCGCGGAPLQKHLIDFFAERGCVIQNGFGMTETSPLAFCVDPQMSKIKIGSVGRTLGLNSVRLDGLADGVSGRGEVQLRGPIITPGYLDAPDLTAACYTDDGWFKTGDVAERDDDGYLFIVDRIKDMYISGGENVYPIEVEKVLNTHPAVLEAAVIGTPHEKWGEVGAAYLLLRPEMKLDVKELKAWCREKIAAYKVPASFDVVTEFSRTATGKIRKPDLIALHAARK